jgi:hypothetical protein
VMRGPDGQWLLPNDGEDEGKSLANSQKIEDVCDGELSTLNKIVATEDLGKFKKPNQ